MTLNNRMFSPFPVGARGYADSIFFTSRLNKDYEEQTTHEDAAPFNVLGEIVEMNWLYIGLNFEQIMK